MSPARAPLSQSTAVIIAAILASPFGEICRTDVFAETPGRARVVLIVFAARFVCVLRNEGSEEEEGLPVSGGTHDRYRGYLLPVRSVWVAGTLAEIGSVDRRGW